MSSKGGLGGADIVRKEPGFPDLGTIPARMPAVCA